jgi:germination protein YpeB
LQSKIRDFTSKNYLTIALAVFIAVTAIWGTVQFNRANKLERTIENIYEMSYYELVDSVSSLDVKLSKLMVTSSEGEAMELLNQINSQTKNATDNLNTLPASHPAVVYTMDFFNLLGDYARSLIKMVGDGQKLNDECYDNLQKMRKSCGGLLDKLNYMSETFEYDPRQDYYANADTPLDRYMANENENDYPTLIYDGPFSEGLKTAQAKAIYGDQVNQEYGLNAAAHALKCSTDQLEFASDINAKIECYMFEKTDDVRATCAITKIGGKLLWLIKAQQECGEILSEQECIRYANVFLNEQGLGNMEKVWSHSYDGQMVLNMAPVVNGVVIYPDLVKVKINMQTGDVLSYDATEYYMNHHDRTINDGRYSLEDAYNVLSPRLDVEQFRTCIIPLAGGNEVLCHEFVASYDGERFYVYINADTNKQEKIFKEVSTPDGSLIV